MNNSASREKILGNIRETEKSFPLANNFKPNWNTPIYKPVNDKLAAFKSELEAIKGECIICENDKELIVKLKGFFEREELTAPYCNDDNIKRRLQDVTVEWLPETDYNAMQVAVSGCEFLVARTGSVIASSKTGLGRSANIFAPIHVIVASAAQLVNTIGDGLKQVRQKYGDALPSMITNITGPSRTADIEKTLVLGAHGPCRLIVFVLK